MTYVQAVNGMFYAFPCWEGKRWAISVHEKVLKISVLCEDSESTLLKKAKSIAWVLDLDLKLKTSEIVTSSTFGVLAEVGEFYYKICGQISVPLRYAAMTDYPIGENIVGFESTFHELELLDAIEGNYSDKIAAAFNIRIFDSIATIKRRILKAVPELRVAGRDRISPRTWSIKWLKS
jgi:hypothetical protein